MVFRIILIYLLSVTLILRPDCVIAKESSEKDPKLMALLTFHQDIKSGNFAKESLDKQGKFLFNQTLAYLNDPKNKSQLKTNEGRMLLRQQAILANYLAVKEHLEKCQTSKENKRDLKNRILSSTLQSAMKNESISSCFQPNNEYKSFVDFNNSVIKVMKVVSKADVLMNLNQKILINSAKSLIGMEYKFNPTFMKKGYLTNGEMNKIKNNICTGNTCKNLSSDFLNNLQSEVVNYANSLPKKEKRFSSKTATIALNQSIQRINQSLDNIKVKTDRGYIYDSANLEDPKTKQEFDSYVYNYMNEVSKDAGPLLLTKTMREKAGQIRNFNSDSTKKDKRTNSFKFEKHHFVTENDINKSIKEANDKINDQIKATQKIIFSESYRKNLNQEMANQVRQENLNEMVKLNPLAAGQMLINHPEYTGIICDSIKNIEANDKDDEDFDKYFMIGGAIIGGALLLTGVGTAVGAYMLTGSLTAGVAAGTVGGSIVSATMLAGAATETVSAAYFGKRSLEAYQEESRIESAILSNNTDQYSILEKRDAYLEFKEARNRALISIASLGFTTIRIDRFFELSRFAQGTLKLNEMKAATKILNYLKEEKYAKKILEGAKLLGGKGSDMLDEFLLRLATVSEKVRINTLELMKDSTITPQKIKEIISESLEMAKKCSKT